VKVKVATRSDVHLWDRVSPERLDRFWQIAWSIFSTKVIWTGYVFKVVRSKSRSFISVSYCCWHWSMYV